MPTVRRNRPARLAGLWCAWLLAATVPAHAAEPAQWWGILTLGSKHFGDERELLREGESFNEFNPGAGIEVQWQPHHAIAGGYFYNSFKEDSWYLLYQYTPLVLGSYVRAGGMIGMVNGYPTYNDGAFAPGAGLVVKIEAARVGANVIYLPKISGKIPNTLGLQLKYRYR